MTSPSPGLRFVDFDLPTDWGSLVGPGQVAVLDDVEDLTICEVCIRTAAREVGLARDPADDPAVQRLREKVQEAEESIRAAQVEQYEVEREAEELELGGSPSYRLGWVGNL
jgi:hypothetical protein